MLARFQCIAFDCGKQIRNHILKNLRNSDWSYTNILFSLFGTRASLSLVTNETYTTPELYPIKYRAEPCVIELNES